MKRNKEVSLTKNKSRYNDDFLLKFRDNTYIFTEETFQEINSTNDWSISFTASNFTTTTFKQYIIQCLENDFSRLQPLDCSVLTDYHTWLIGCLQYLN